ncbi:hypothetical protein KC926_03310 [Candidatus Kaiserbacteria bacterium]|nr:hypothetical protein [Candidatus Kaiserbacteria bacterium]
MENQTAKHFALQLGSLGSLYLSLSFLLVLIFGIINLAFPDAAAGAWEAESAAGSVRIGIAIVVVFFPTYIYLTRIVNQNRRQNSDNHYLSLTKWLIYLSLVVGGAVLLGDLVAVMISFLEGDITQRFVLKALAVLVVIGGAFYYYAKDAKGYWVQNEKQSIIFATLMSVIVLTSVIVGFMQIPTPTEYRSQKLDQTQLNDLQSIQWRIEEHIATNGNLPENLEALYQNQSQVLPTAPENRDEYSYEVTETGFELCATFSKSSEQDSYYSRPYTKEFETPTIINPDNWNYAEGRYCFERVVK